MIKRALVAVLEHARAELLDAISAIERGDPETAIEKLGSVTRRLRDAARGTAGGSL